MKAKDDKLYKYIDGRLDYVIKNLRDITLPDFNAYERKKIHTYISSKNIP
jgi:predicted RNA-binding protein Jag